MSLGKRIFKIAEKMLEKNINFKKRGISLN